MNNIKTKFNVGQAMPDVKKGSPCRKDAPLSSSRYSPYGRMRDIRGAIKNFAAPIPRIETLRGDEARSSGFTLIELLVVVLIIGILAAVALPQYQVSVAKTRYAALKNITRSIANAEEVYYLANGHYAMNFEELSIGIPNIQNSYLAYPATSVTCTYFDNSATSKGTYCQNDKIKLRFQISFNHTGGKTGCVTLGDKANTTEDKICKAETKDSHPTVTTGFYRHYQYK